MFYKFGLEFFNGSITTLATDRFNAASTFTKRTSYLPLSIHSAPHRASVVGAAQGINQAAQCVGAILIAPMIKQWPTRTVLSAAILFFGLMTTILLIVDAATSKSIYSLFPTPPHVRLFPIRRQDQALVFEQAYIRYMES
jgi:hypothetical protein